MRLVKLPTVQTVSLDLALFFAAILPAGITFAEEATIRIQSRDDHHFRIENAALARDLSVEGGVLRTTGVLNKLAGTVALPSACSEFCLRVSEGTHTTGTGRRSDLG